MCFYDELFFEITLEGAKSDLKRCVAFLKSGELDDFFEISSDYICYDDDYADAADGDKCSIVFTNDDLGVEIDRFDPTEFLEVLCEAARALDVVGRLYDVDGEECAFTSPMGDCGFYFGTDRFNDELDEVAYDEEAAADEDEE